jgi:hypothetical protein
VKETALEKKLPAPLREKGQYALVFSVIALMLFAAGFPPFLLFFIGVLSFFIWKVFSVEGRQETRRIFEFYLSANEILREDDRRWYGFEIQETIGRGEHILRSMSAAPPLVHFALGALYQKLGDHSSAVKHLSHVVDEDSKLEFAIVYPTKELRDYVHMLRKIERGPAEAPLTSAAVRSLERARKNKGQKLLEYSRSQLAKVTPQLHPSEQKLESVVDMASYREAEDADIPASPVYLDNGDVPQQQPLRFASSAVQTGKKNNSPQPDRKSISEVLHDIYDKNIQ